MKISEAVYEASIAGADPIMDEQMPQVAFLGRSNVGKSSLINALVGRKNLARPSSTPGKTKRIYFYRINNDRYFVDLPGYGFAKVSKGKQEDILRMIGWYVEAKTGGRRKFVLIIDAKVGPTEDDMGAMAGLAKTGEPVLVVATKADKEQKSRLGARKEELEKKLGQQVIMASVKSRRGLEEIWQWINE